MDIRLDGRKALVTGAARGIGRAISDALACSGAEVIVADIDMDSAREAASAIGSARAAYVDVADTDSCRSLFEQAVREMGRLDILVNNAGICPLRALPEVDRDFFDRLVAANVRGGFFLSQAAAVHMRERQTGRIINIASVGGKTGGYLDIAVYCMTKAALFSMTRSFARFLAPGGTVNTIAPGLTDTQLMVDWDSPSLVEDVRNATLLKRLGRPEDYAAAAVWLASDAASYVTGATIDINGGLRMD